MRKYQESVNRGKMRGGKSVCVECVGVEGHGAGHGEYNCMQCAECSGPAVRSPFISGLSVRYNLPGCQDRATVSHPTSWLPLFFYHSSALFISLVAALRL